MFLQNTSCIRKPQVISGGVDTPCTLPLDPPLATHCELLLFHLLGEHIDYCGYGVLPMAVEQDIVIAVGQNDKKMLNLSNTFNSFQ